MAKNKGGRPTVMTPEVVVKLEQAFSMGCTDVEACFYANISKDALYDYQNKTEGFAERKEQLKQRPILLARQSVINHMQEDGNLAMKFLERKKKDEFAPKQTIDNNHSGSISIGDILNEIDGRSAGLPENKE